MRWSSSSLGFFITAFVFLSVLFARLRRAPRADRCRWRSRSPWLIHYAFYSLLRVPLPWGVLEGVAW